MYKIRKYLVIVKSPGLLLLLILGFYNAEAQTTAVGNNTLLINSLYTAKSDFCMDATITLRVSGSKSGLVCTISKNDEKLKGYLVKDSQKVNRDTPDLYRFYLPKRSIPLLLIRFYRDDDYKATIYNRDYLEIFKPCFDLKGIELTVEKYDK